MPTPFLLVALLVACGLIFFVTCFASTYTPILFCNRISFRIFVSLWTMSAFSFVISPTGKINSSGDRLQVVGVDAASDPAKMVRLQSLGDCSFMEDVGFSVSSAVFSNGRVPSHSIASVIERSHPYPASAFGYHLHSFEKVAQVVHAFNYTGVAQLCQLR